MGRLIVVTLVLLLAACDPPPPSPDTIRVSDALGGGDTSGFRRALEPRTFEFLADHGPHPGFKHEWWYITGNLDTADGRTLGYHLTFFRIALESEPPDRVSRWAARQVWMGHLALTEVAAGRHTARERIVREALGLAGGEGLFLLMAQSHLPLPRLLESTTRRVVDDWTRSISCERPVGRSRCRYGAA